MTEPAAAPAAEVKAPAAAPNVPAERFTFYFSASHRATYAAGRSLSFFKDQEFTEIRRIGEAPAKRPDTVTLGTGTMADVTTRKPA